MYTSVGVRLSVVCSGGGAACSIVVKLLDLDPQGWWFDKRP